MAHITPFKAVVPQMEQIEKPESFFKQVKDDFQGLMKKGLFRQEEEEVFFLHRVQTKFRSYTGLLCCIHIEDYINGHIKKHENTISAKEDRTHGLFQQRGGLIKPVLLTYPNLMEIDSLTNRLTFSIKPMMEFAYDDEYHTFWRIDQPEYKDRYKELFAEKVENTYIADGHHRIHTAMNQYVQKRLENPQATGNEPWNWLMVGLFPTSEIEIHNYNRLLTHLGGLSKVDFLKKLEKSFIVEHSFRSVKPETPQHMGLYLRGDWYKLVVRPEFMEGRNDLRERLDVTLFNEAVLRDTLGVEDVRRYEGISYQEGPKGTQGLIEAVDNRSAAAAFNLYPLPYEYMIDISNADGVLPPKSTWFFPRLRSGFVAQLF